MRQHGDRVAEGVIGQIGQIVTMLAERDEGNAQASYDVTAAPSGPGPRREPAQPAY